MATIEFDLATTLAREEVIDLFTDFTPRRPERWPGLDPKVYEVYRLGETSAEVREGNPPNYWAKETYDWSVPGKVRWEVQESSFCEPGSYVEATIKDDDNGGSVV